MTKASKTSSFVKPILSGVKSHHWGILYSLEIVFFKSNLGQEEKFLVEAKFSIQKYYRRKLFLVLAQIFPELLLLASKNDKNSNIVF